MAEPLTNLHDKSSEQIISLTLAGKLFINLTIMDLLSKHCMV